MNPDMKRLVDAAQRVAAEAVARGVQPSTESVLMAVLEEMKQPTASVNENMLPAMQAVKGALPTPVEIAMVSAGFFAILGTYRGTIEDEDE